MWILVETEQGIAKLNTDFVAVVYPDKRVIVLSSGKAYGLTEADYNMIDQKMFPTRTKVAKDDTELAEFLNQLHRLTGGKNSAILTPQRNKKLTDLLKSFSREQLVVAATNIGKDDWLQGKNETKKRYGDIDYLLRPDKAAKWAEVNPEDRRKSMF